MTNSRSQEKCENGAYVKNNKFVKLICQNMNKEMDLAHLYTEYGNVMDLIEVVDPDKGLEFLYKNGVKVKSIIEICKRVNENFCVFDSFKLRYYIKSFLRENDTNPEFTILSQYFDSLKN